MSAVDACDGTQELERRKLRSLARSCWVSALVCLMRAARSLAAFRRVIKELDRATACRSLPPLEEVVEKTGLLGLGDRVLDHSELRGDRAKAMVILFG